MANFAKVKEIVEAVERIEQSSLSAEEYIQRYGAPFSIAQFYRYRARLSSEGEEGLQDKRCNGNNSKLNKEQIGFVRGFIKNRTDVSPTQVQRAIEEEFSIKVHRSTTSRLLNKLGVKVRRNEDKNKEQISCAGFEIIAALALHLGWVEHTGKSIMEAIEQRCRERQPSGRPEKKGRNSKGQFTEQYNKREEIRRARFESMDEKRTKKNLRRMNVCKRSGKNLQKKSLAVLALPLVTLNGYMRNVNTAIGNAIKGFCGYNYKQSTLDRFLRELKYLGISEHLLCEQIPFWQQQWSQAGEQLELPFLCYYIDGNTKAVWSKKRVKKNKVTMLGRVMGCLEQVFVHDCFGHPIYFETYSGHGPVGVYTLELMEKIERYMQEVVDDEVQVNRVLVMDGANNSVATLRAFALQNRYHYITLLDPNQWSERKVRHHGTPERYRWGNATLYDSEIELKDSKDKGYLIAVRAVRIEWDHGKRTVLLTSLPANTVGASLVVKAYFDRWPQQELVFRGMKGFASLHRVAGYGKKEELDSNVRAKQRVLEENIQILQDLLRGPLEQIAQYTGALTALIAEERVIRARSCIEDGQRVQIPEDAEALKSCTRQIGGLLRRIKNIEKANKNAFDKLYSCQTRWMRLQGKETVYKVDVELDQIVTYFRVSLANLGAYFLKEFLGMGPTCFATLMQSILLLDGEFEETKKMRKVIINRNRKDLIMMERLESALAKLNSLSLRTLSGKRYYFVLS